MAEAYLASSVTGAAIAAPSHGLVEGEAPAVTFDGPKNRLVVAIGLQVSQSDRHERGSDASTPMGLIDGDGVDLAQFRVHGVSAGSDAGEPDYFPQTFGDPPSIRDRPGEVAAPALGELGRHGPVSVRQQRAEAGVPRLDVDARYVFGVGRCGWAEV